MYNCLMSRSTLALRVTLDMNHCPIQMQMFKLSKHFFFWLLIFLAQNYKSFMILNLNIYNTIKCDSHAALLKVNIFIKLQRFGQSKLNSFTLQRTCRSFQSTEILHQIDQNLNMCKCPIFCTHHSCVATANCAS